MARSRRGGFQPPELRGTLGTLLRTTLAQAGAVRDALERGAREGRSRLDGFRADRRRQEALAELGEIVLELVRAGEIDLGELPEAKSIVAELEELDAGDEEEPAPRGIRKRFDARGRDDDDGTVSALADRPPTPRPDPVWRPGAEPERRGGIVFDDGDDDDDLERYMHPDDVPPKPET